MIHFNLLISLIIILSCSSIIKAYNNKICWQECTDLGVVKRFEADGCIRRKTPNGKEPRFRCDGVKGPPCIVKPGGSAIVTTELATDKVLKKTTQKAFWESSWGVDFPFVGIDNNVCNYITNNMNCTSNTPLEKQIIVFPVNINKMYPTGKFNVRWEIYNNEDYIACYRFIIKIVK